ncbi:6-phosphofructokinase [Intestinimonas butyriciproducens]|uniref:Pyrophosphate--fructose 6-phosphate 1-phosphotransferase n=1 Tax=Candidatus Intestinimonas merdavium TaxID=2838622 RepID=A0A9D2CEG3_9FIRM|nr:6-phosphofructokinase [Intestinimonas butyriciproducens]MBM6976316.1 6-phosphofructokinase [Intestinimonas butyriciproducens]HIY73155.1 6-phosphofructokinase [Candidatus Intestinimonas merdavium]
MGKNILVAHGGGPTAVINCSLQGVVEAARASGQVDKIYAARFGAEGILAGDLIDLTDVPAETISRLRDTPASAIGSCRRKLGDADYPTVLETLRRFGIDCFFYNGGNDSMDTCNKVNELAKKEGLDLRVIGIPKTMDNDLEITDHCPGFGSAARYAAQSACELALDASALPIHVVVLELMGRNAGWVTAASALAARLTNCEVLTYLPERLVDEEKMLSDIEARYAKGKGLLVTVSEGICGLDGKPFADTGLVDGFGHTIPGGTAQHISDQIIQKLGLKSRAEKPGLLGRTSIPYVSAPDREEAYAVGKYAVEAALRGESGSMVAIEAQRSPAYHSSLFLTPLSQVANVEKKFPLEWIVEGNQIADAFFDYAMPLMGGGFPQYALLRK